MSPDYHQDWGQAKHFAIIACVRQTRSLRSQYFLFVEQQQFTLNTGCSSIWMYVIITNLKVTEVGRSTAMLLSWKHHVVSFPLCHYASILFNLASLIRQLQLLHANYDARGGGTAMPPSHAPFLNCLRKWTARVRINSLPHNFLWDPLRHCCLCCRHCWARETSEQHDCIFTKFSNTPQRRLGQLIGISPSANEPTRKALGLCWLPFIRCCIRKWKPPTRF